MVEIGENVRGRDIYVVQSTCSPTNNNLMELLIMMDALKRASAATITAVIPYYGYARQDRKVAPRTPITSKLVADLITTAGADRVVTIDLHAGQIQGFFNIPVDNLYAAPVMLEHLKKRFTNSDAVMVSPDAGGTERARAFAKRLGCTLAVIDKRRTGPNVAEVMHLIGDVKGKAAIILDDMIDTAGTLTQAARALERARRQVDLCLRHPRRPFRTGHRPDQRLCHRGSAHYRHHSSWGEGAADREGQGALCCRTSGGGDQADT